MADYTCIVIIVSPLLAIILWSLSIIADYIITLDHYKSIGDYCTEVYRQKLIFEIWKI